MVQQFRCQTPENQAVYPQPDSQKEGIGFPIARIVTVISCVTGAVLDMAIGPYSGKETGEHALLRQKKKIIFITALLAEEKHLLIECS